MKLIPRDRIRHLEWQPGEEVAKVVEAPKRIINPSTFKFSIEDLLNSSENVFYNKEKNKKGLYIGVAKALEEAINTMSADSVIASMPYHIAGKAVADKDNYLWQQWYTCLSEENVGIDKDGMYVGKGKPIVVTVHGGGLLTPERIFQAYKEGLTPQNAAKYVPEEFDDLLKGKLPNGEEIPFYSVDDVIKGNIAQPFGRYAVWMDFEEAKKTKSDYHKKTDFLKNPLVLCRAGTLEYLEQYFDKAKSGDTVANWHIFNEIDYNQSQGRLLFFNYNYCGLNGYYLNSDGRFIGVGERSS